MTNETRDDLVAEAKPPGRRGVSVGVSPGCLGVARFDAERPVL